MSNEDLIQYFYAGGDMLLCNIRLIVVYSCLFFGLMLISVASEALRSA